MITYLAKIGELTLKGSNLHEFEKLLLQNARRSLQGSEAKVSLRAGRLYIDCEDADSSKAETALTHLLGITGWAKTRVCEKNIDSIGQTVLEEAKNAAALGAKTFKIEARRSDKAFELNSYDIACRAASPVFDAGVLKVDVHKPDVKIFVEVRERCFVFSDAKKAVAGFRQAQAGKDCSYFQADLTPPSQAT